MGAKHWKNVTSGKKTQRVSTDAIRRDKRCQLTTNYTRRKHVTSAKRGKI